MEERKLGGATVLLSSLDDLDHLIVSLRPHDTVDNALRHRPPVAREEEENKTMNRTRRRRMKGR